MSAGTHHDRRVRRAVLPAAGLGTRFLPASKAVPKELAVLVDKPAIQYIVEECARAGLDDVVLVTSRGKSAIEDHFDRALELEDALKAKGKQVELDEIRRIAELATIHSVRQPEPLGLGHAVLMARDHVGDQPFAVLLGDDLIDPAEPLLERMVAAHEATGRAVVALMEIPPEDVSLYGVATVRDPRDDGTCDIVDLVEKPAVDEAPSNLIVIGRYVLPGAIFDVLERTPPGKGGEIQLTDAMRVLIDDGPLVGVTVDPALRYDAGDKLSYLKAVVQLAVQHDELGPPFHDWLTGFLRERG